MAQAIPAQFATVPARMRIVVDISNYSKVVPIIDFLIQLHGFGPTETSSFMNKREKIRLVFSQQNKRNAELCVQYFRDRIMHGQHIKATYSEELISSEDFNFGEAFDLLVEMNVKTEGMEV